MSCVPRGTKQTAWSAHWLITRFADIGTFHVERSHTLKSNVALKNSVGCPAVSRGTIPRRLPKSPGAQKTRDPATQTLIGEDVPRGTRETSSTEEMDCREQATSAGRTATVRVRNESGISGREEPAQESRKLARSTHPIRKNEASPYLSGRCADTTELSSFRPASTVAETVARGSARAIPSPSLAGPASSRGPRSTG